jgi:hypothetical protein
MKDAFWFRHDSNAHNDLKIRMMRKKKFGWQGYGWYWYFIETLRDSTDYSMPYSDLTCELLADDLNCKPEEVKEWLDYCVEIGLLRNIDGNISSFRLIDDMAKMGETREKFSLAGKRSAEVRRAASQGNSPTLPPAGKKPASVIVEPQAVKTYGDFKNVKLTDDEYKKLADKYTEPKLKEMIDKLDNYIERTPVYKKKVQSFPATIQAWFRNDAKAAAPFKREYNEVPARGVHIVE